MSSEWQEYRLGDITRWASGGTPSKQNPEYWGGSIPWISASSMKSKICANSDECITEEAVRSGARMCDPGTILLLVRGSELHKRIPIGVAMKRVAFNQDVKAITTCSGNLSGDYLYYLLKGSEEFLLKSVEFTGIGAGKLETPFLQDLVFPLPTREEQAVITDFMIALDDKIELNRKTNETLEAMAKALFKSWFVDFDPVRAKAEGRSTGLPAEISDLFPDSFEDSELGEIPRGWKVGTIASSVGEVFDGPHATPKEAEEGNVFLGIKNMTGSSLNLSDVKLIGHDDWSQWTRRVEPRADDIVFTYEAALGLFAVIPHGLKCCLGRRMALIRTKAPNGAPHFWFHQFIAKPFQKVIEERSIHGATVNRTPLTEFPGYPILEPPENLRLAFDHTMSSLWARINAAANQTSSLTSLRDTLLPKLISGELRIPDAEKMLEEVGV
jgi:type I restriction enzyme S subunit